MPMRKKIRKIRKINSVKKLPNLNLSRMSFKYVKNHVHNKKRKLKLWTKLKISQMFLKNRKLCWIS